VKVYAQDALVKKDDAQDVALAVTVVELLYEMMGEIQAQERKSE
jgi:hypothetical protein